MSQPRVCAACNAAAGSTQYAACVSAASRTTRVVSGAGATKKYVSNRRGSYGGVSQIDHKAGLFGRLPDSSPPEGRRRVACGGGPCSGSATGICVPQAGPVIQHIVALVNFATGERVVPTGKGKPRGAVHEENP